MFPSGRRGFFVEDPAGSGGTWGSITGTLSAQLDLQAALDAAGEPLTNGDATNPEIMFDAFGEVVMA